MAGVSALIVLALWSAPVDRVPIAENFHYAESVTMGVLSAGIIVFQTVYVPLANPDRESFGEPVFGGPNALDRAVSDAAMDPEGGSVHHDIPNGVPYLLVAGFGGYLLVEATSTWTSGRSLFEDDANADHTCLAFVEGYAVMGTLTILTEYGLGRRRPYVDKELAATHDQGFGSETSFYSGYSANAFFGAALLSRYLDDRIDDALLSVAPYVGLYSVAAYASYARIYEQQHYFTDAVVGATVATLAANLAYSFHIDGGAPRRAVATQARLLPIAFEGGGGLGVTARW
jgi:membrane-associated phospholipid phosphatase